jgi:hypothetical protein
MFFNLKLSKSLCVLSLVALIQVGMPATPSQAGILDTIGGFIGIKPKKPQLPSAPSLPSIPSIPQAPKVPDAVGQIVGNPATPPQAAQSGDYNVPTYKTGTSIARDAEGRIVSPVQQAPVSSSSAPGNYPSNAGSATTQSHPSTNSSRSTEFDNYAIHKGPERIQGYPATNSGRAGELTGGSTAGHELRPTPSTTPQVYGPPTKAEFDRQQIIKEGDARAASGKYNERTEFLPGSKEQKIYDEEKAKRSGSGGGNSHDKTAQDSHPTSSSGQTDRKSEFDGKDDGENKAEKKHENKESGSEQSSQSGSSCDKYGFCDLTYASGSSSTEYKVDGIVKGIPGSGNNLLKKLANHCIKGGCSSMGGLGSFVGGELGGALGGTLGAHIGSGALGAALSGGNVFDGVKDGLIGYATSQYPEFHAVTEGIPSIVNNIHINGDGNNVNVGGNGVNQASIVTKPAVSGESYPGRSTELTGGSAISTKAPAGRAGEFY